MTFKFTQQQFFILLFICCFSSLKTVFAQKYNFTNFRISNGLPINHILSVEQASNGKLWIGTTNGLCVYDGQTFKKFPKELVIDNSPINAIVQDKFGLIWIGTKYKGLVSYDGIKFNFYNKKHNLKNSPINSLCTDSAGRLWVASNSGVSIWDGKVFKNLKRSDGLISDTVLKVLCDKKGGVWFSTYKGLSYFFNNKFKNFTVNNGLPANLIYTTYLDKKGVLWFSTYGCISNYDGKKFNHYHLNQSLNTDRITAFLEDHSGQLWVGSFGEGFGMFNAGEIKMIDNSEGLTNNVVNAMIEDREGNLWIGTTNGLSKYSGNRFINYTTDEGLTNNNILSLYISPQNRIWIGTNGGGLNCLTDKSFSIYNNNTLSESASIWSIYKDKSGLLWLGTTNGAVCYNEKKETFTKPIPAVANQIVYSIFQSKNGDMYFGTDKGLLVINDTSEKTITLNDGLLNEKVRCIYQDINGIVWIGTLKGVFYIKNKIIHNFNKENNIQVSPITCIIEDTINGRLIITTYGFGLINFSTKEDKFKPLILNMDNGIINNSLLFCLLDKNNLLWLGSTKEISTLDWNLYLRTQKANVSYYDRSNGYNGFESNTAAMDINGDMWFGTTNGLIKHNANSTKSVSIKPLISITNVQLFLSDVNWKKRYENLDKITGLPNRLVLKYNENHISFEFQGIYLTAPQELHYSYTLSGLDKDWLPMTAHNEAYYPNLNAGEYIFKVRATVNGKDWSEPTVFFFKINPPWWKTIWAYIFYVLSGSTFLYGVLFLRTRRLEKSRNALSQKVIERTRDLNAINIKLSKTSLVASETANAVLIFDANLELDYANDGFSKMTGYSMDELVQMRGKTIYQITFNEDINQVLAIALKEKRSTVYESHMQCKDGVWIWTSTTLTPIFNPAGNLKNIVVIDTDISETKKIEQQLKDSLDERGLLLKEIHHRVKNNLQIIISLFNLQSNYITDDNALKALKEGQNRIKSMALIHERFYQSEGLSKIDFDGYIQRLTENLFLTYNIANEKVKLIIDADKVALDIDTAVPCGLIINELISNSLKYAFNDQLFGEVYINFKMLDDEKCQLSIGDNGIGLKTDFDIENSDTLGMQLVHALTDQLDGTVSIVNKKGLHFKIEFKRQAK